MASKGKKKSSIKIVLRKRNEDKNKEKVQKPVGNIRKFNVCILGSGNWGSAIAKIVGDNCAKLPDFEKIVPMYVYEENVEGQKLTDIINTKHENVKYLKGYQLPKNVYATSDPMKAASNADVLIFVLPPQYVNKLCKDLIRKVKPTAHAISLIKGFERIEGGGLELISNVIKQNLNIPCSVLTGATLANEVIRDKFCEATIGCRDMSYARILRDIFQSDNFRVFVVDDADSVEICSALKNIVACAAGFVDGMGMGGSTKATVIRLGLMEMIKFVTIFYPGSRTSTFFQSCGVADLVATCYGGRNQKVAAAMVNTGKTLEALEKEMINGQKLPGPPTAAEVNNMLKYENLQDNFPLFTAVHNICTGKIKPIDLIEMIRSHPENAQQLQKTSTPGNMGRRRRLAWLKACCSPQVDYTQKCRRFHTSAPAYIIENTIKALKPILLAQKSGPKCDIPSKKQVSYRNSLKWVRHLQRLSHSHQPWLNIFFKVVKLYATK